MLFSKVKLNPHQVAVYMHRDSEVAIKFIQKAKPSSRLSKFQSNKNLNLKKSSQPSIICL